MKIRRLLISIIVPISLILMAIILLFLQTYRIEKGFFILTYGHASSEYSAENARELLAGEIVEGSFIAKENHLGIVGIRFTTFWRINEDELIFRIKAADDSDWYYENVYKADQFQPDQIFPFGFPEISDSQNKKYIFQVESKNGLPGNAIGLNTKFPSFVSKYRYDKSVLMGQLNIKFLSDKYRSIKLEDLEEIFNQVIGKVSDTKQENSETLPYFQTSDFIFKKFFTILKFEENGYLFVYYLFPLFVYIILNPTIKNHYKKYRQYILVIPGLILLSIIFKNYIKDAAYISILFLWINAIHTYKIKPVISLYIAIVLIILSCFSYYLINPQVSEKFGVWSFLSFGILVCMTIIKNIFKKYQNKQLL